MCSDTFSMVCGVFRYLSNFIQGFLTHFDGLWSVPLSFQLYTKFSDTFSMVCGVFRYPFNFKRSVPTHFQWFVERSATFLTLYKVFRHIFNGLWNTLYKVKK